MIMKFLLGLTLLSFSAMAANQNSSWQEIQNDWDLETHEASINFSGTLVSVFDVCHLDEKTLKTKKPITIYEWVDDDNHKAVGKGFKTTSVNYERVVVDGDGTVTEPAVYSLNYNVKVTTDTYEGGGTHLFTKKYSIEACK